MYPAKSKVVFSVEDSEGEYIVNHFYSQKSLGVKAANVFSRISPALKVSCFPLIQGGENETLRQQADQTAAATASSGYGGAYPVFQECRPQGGKEVWMKYAKTCLPKICNDECDVKTAGVLVLKNLR